MTTPVFVIHGVGKRSKKEFTADVAKFGRAVGVPHAHPIYWGNLGANYHHIADTVPVICAPTTEVRGELAPVFLGDETELASEAPSGEQVPQSVVDAVQETLAPPQSIGVEIRDGTDGDISAEVLNALKTHWSKMPSLSQIGDEELLRAVGAAVAGSLADQSSGYLGEGIWGLTIDISGFVRKRLEELDRVVGAAVGAAAGRLNSQLRTKFLPGITRAVGDIIVYQSHRDSIQKRVRDAIDQVEPSLGLTKDHPVDVLAHSLGGVIAVDMAVAEKPLWIRRLVTFGSQSPFFHVCDPRGGVLLKYLGTPVQMPATVGQWTNLWEPLDPVAFVAKPIFRLNDGSSPIDTEVPHLASSGLWTHTDYWTHPDVLAQIRAVLETDAGGPT
jgi:hypothetical protein